MSQLRAAKATANIKCRFAMLKYGCAYSIKKYWQKKFKDHIAIKKILLGISSSFIT